ncbi:hypothetical protein M1O51_04390 [Dehalococcoidia bacterium]|nr:hypothetical protein [Dehalococcoidia bacterium]
MDRGSYLEEVDTLISGARHSLLRALRKQHLRMRVYPFLIAGALGIVLLLSALIPVASEVSLPEMIVETNDDQVMVRDITVRLSTYRPPWGIALIVVASLLAPVVPILIDALFQAGKDAEAQLPFEVRNQLLEDIAQMKQSNRISNDTAVEAHRMIDRLPDCLDRERLREILLTLKTGSGQGG